MQIPKTNILLNKFWVARAVAERDAVLKQADSAAHELSQMRESAAVLQQQLQSMKLEKKAETDKNAKVQRQLQ